MNKKKIKNTLNIKNRRAFYEYNIIEKYLAGLILLGSEVKSIKKGKVSLNESFCYIRNSELWIKQMHIGHYEQANIYNHEELRLKKLLLKKQEINKLKKSKEKGMTIIPLRLFINKTGFIKLEIGLAKGKNLYDKRQSIKEKDLKRQVRKIY